MEAGRNAVLRIIFIVFSLGAVGHSTTAAQVAGARLDPDLQSAIEKSYPGAIVASRYRNDPCPVPPNHLGWVKADFNGDGRPDHAVLLSIANTSAIGMGKRYDFVLAVFLRHKSNEYRPIIVETIFENEMNSIGTTPDDVTGIFIQRLQPGPFKGTGKDGKGIFVLTNPGIYLRQCESWYHMWYWNTKEARFKDMYEEYFLAHGDETGTN